MRLRFQPVNLPISNSRHGRFREAETLRFVLEKVLRRCIDAELVGGEGFAVDASVVTRDIDFKKPHKGEASNNVVIAAVSHYVI